jgi:hypothetical protein
MTDVLVERKYPEPLTDEVLQRNLENALACLDLHYVDWLHSFMSPDRRELVCHFRARDAESVRLALQQAGAQRGLVWSGTVHDAAGSTELLDGGILVCRRVAAPARFDETGAAGSDEALCLSNHRVTLLRCYVSKDRRRMIGVYRAPDAESVRRALRDDSAPFESVWPCRHMRP